MADIDIKPLTYSPQILEELSNLLIEIVEDGGSVSFMYPLQFDEAQSFWRNWLTAAQNGERIVLGAFVDEILIGTVTLLLDLPPNQPHRAEIAKMMTRISHRGMGVATKLMEAAERIALEKNKTLLVLDTAVEDGASKFYERLGFNLTGVIPDYALKPHGGLTGTMIYWKRIGK